MSTQQDVNKGGKQDPGYRPSQQQANDGEMNQDNQSSQSSQRAGQARQSAGQSQASQQSGQQASQQAGQQVGQQIGQQAGQARQSGVNAFRSTQPSRLSDQNAAALLPRVDVYEDPTGITLLADMPGVQRDQLDIRVEGETLRVEGEIAPNTPEALEATYAEVQTPRYRRTFSLSRELDTTKIDAVLKDGVLSLRIPKQEHAQPRRVSVRASS